MRIHWIAVGLLWGTLAVNAFSQFEVRQDGTGTHTSISAALAAAPFGATIEITDNGIYQEDLVIGTPGISLRAAQYRFPVVTPLALASGSIHCSIIAPGVTVEGLAFEGTGSSGHGMVVAPGLAAVTITGCRIANFQGAGAQGLHLAGGGQFGIRITGCRLENNRRGLTIDQVEDTTVDNTLVYAESAAIASVDWGVKAVNAPSGLGLRHLTVNTDQLGPAMILDIMNLIAPTPGGDIVGLPLPGSGAGMVYLANSIISNGAPNFSVTGNPLGVNFNCLDLADAAIPSLPPTNIFGDPMFRGLFEGNFDIDIFSPCRNTAPITFTDEIPDDIQGTGRMIGGAPDRGAYEATGASCLLDWEWMDPFLVYHLESPPGLHLGQEAVFAMSASSGQGIQIPFGRLPLAFDMTMAFGLDPANAFLFSNMNGIIPASGSHTGMTFIPPSAQPALSGATFFVAYVILQTGSFFDLQGHSIAARPVIP